MFLIKVGSIYFLTPCYFQPQYCRAHRLARSASSCRFALSTGFVLICA
jgi:hypothetical protein